MFCRKWHSQRLCEYTEGDIDTYFNADHSAESNEKSIVQFQESITTQQMIISIVQKVIKNSRDSPSRPQAAKFKPYL
jgi:hypothetical protein